MTDRGSSQHSPRVDDELAHETEGLVRGAHESHVEEWRMTEPPADDEPMPEPVLHDDDIDFRSLLATSLRPSVFPCERARLLGVAEQEFAPGRVVAALRTLPADREFHNVEEVWEALGGTREQREHQMGTTVTEPPPAPPNQQPSLAEQAGALCGAVARLACDVVSDAVRRVRSLI